MVRRWLLTVALILMVAQALVLLPVGHRSEMRAAAAVGLGLGVVAAAVWGLAWLLARRRVLGATVLLCLISAGGGVLLGQPPMGAIVLMALTLALPVVAFEWDRVRTTLFLTVASVLAAFWMSGPWFDLRPALDERAPVSSHDLVVISWNLGQAAPFGGASDPDGLDDVADVIRESAAHVACLQELDGPAHLARLLDLLGSDWRGAVSEPSGKATAIVTRVDGLLSSPLPELAFGGPTVLRFDHGGRQLVIASVHLPTHSAAERASYVERVASLSAGTLLVVAGDLNMDPMAFWDRVCPLFSDDRAQDLRTLARLQALGDDPGAALAPTALFSRRLDAVLVTPGLKTVAYRVLLDAARGLMDHRPVVARVR